MAASTCTVAKAACDRWLQRDGLRALGEQSLPAAENHRNRDESVFVDEVVLDQRP
jgi:hypothetical protein